MLIWKCAYFAASIKFWRYKKSESFIMLNCDYCALTGSLAAPCLWLQKWALIAANLSVTGPMRVDFSLFYLNLSHLTKRKEKKRFFSPFSTHAHTHVVKSFIPSATSLFSDNFRKTSKLGGLIKPVYMIWVDIHRYKSEIRGPFTELENARILHPFNFKKYTQNCESPRVENLLKTTIFPWWANGQQGAFAEA